MSIGIDGYLASPTSTATAATTTAVSPYSTLPPTNPFADPNGPFANLNLTSDQQSQIQKLFSENPQNGSQSPTQLFQQVESILTPQQQQTLRGDLETSSAHHHHHHASSSSANDSSTTSAAAYTPAGAASPAAPAATVDTDA